MGRILGVLCLSGLRFFLGGLFFCEEHLYILLRFHQFLHLVPRLSVGWISGFLLRKQCRVFILAFGEHKFFIDRQGTAFVTADQFALLCLVGVLCIIRAAFQAGRNGFSLVFVQCNQSCCCQFYHLPAKRKCRTMAAF